MNMAEHTIKFVFGNNAEDMKADLCDSIQDHISKLDKRSKESPTLNQKLQYTRTIKELSRFQRALILVHYDLEDALVDLS